MKLPFRLFRRREARRPTVLGWLLILLATAALLRLAAPGAYQFLACSRGAPGDYVVIEGWLSDDALPAALEEIARPGCRQAYATGGPLETGEFLQEYRDWAHVLFARLVQSGVASNRVTAVPAPRVRRDRTYASALALRDHFAAAGIRGGRVTLVTSAPHARRSRFLFRKALGPSFQVGVRALEPERFNAGDWWKSSEGFRFVTSELLAYVYSQVNALIGRDE